MTGPLCPISICGSPVALLKFQMAPRLNALNVLWLQEKGAQIHMSEWSQSFTLTKYVGRGFIFFSTPTQWTFWRPYWVKMSHCQILKCIFACHPQVCDHTLLFVFKWYSRNSTCRQNDWPVGLETVSYGLRFGIMITVIQGGAKKNACFWNG